MDLKPTDLMKIDGVGGLYWDQDNKGELWFQGDELCKDLTTFLGLI